MYHPTLRWVPTAMAWWALRSCPAPSESPHRFGKVLALHPVFCGRRAWISQLRTWCGVMGFSCIDDDSLCSIVTVTSPCILAEHLHRRVPPSARPVIPEPELPPRSQLTDRVCQYIDTKCDRVTISFPNVPIYFSIGLCTLSAFSNALFRSQEMFTWM